MIETLLNDGWDYHATESERLARELEAAVDAPIQTAHILPLMHLGLHTIGEHLRDWPRALDFARRVMKDQTPTAETARAWARFSIAALLGGDTAEAALAEITCLKASSDFTGAYLDMRLLLANALIGSRRFDEGAAIYKGALALAQNLPRSPLSDRSIAATSNNIGWDLYDLPARSAAEDALMRLAAENSHSYWLKVGTWINEERALYFRALVANALGDFNAALSHADAALAVIAANGKRPLDEALLRLARAKAFLALGDANAGARERNLADERAAGLVDPALKREYETERAKLPATG